MMRQLFWAILFANLSVSLAAAELRKPFPAHWGTPPEIQTQDYVELPDGYGHGSSTLKHWITANLTKDKTTGSAPSPTVLYSQDFEKLSAGPLTEEFMVLGGEFVVKAEGTNKFLELPGAPLDTFAVQFGPGERENVAVRARVLGTSKGRRTPTFGVGLGGVSGFKLQVAPGKKALELLKDLEPKTNVSFDWKSGEWVQLLLQIRQVKEGEWRIEGKAWAQGSTEPQDWMISFHEKEEPIPGKASVLGSPFSGTPIWFDDLLVEKIGK
ncbi:MAG TPA: hypothetical protein VFZ59_11765 [Verrucomicrobiae bacterium]|nr:hypothetical protein [Verrucomicrobiae bacterium]